MAKSSTPFLLLIFIVTITHVAGFLRAYSTLNQLSAAPLRQAHQVSSTALFAKKKGKGPKRKSRGRPPASERAAEFGIGDSSPDDDEGTKKPPVSIPTGYTLPEKKAGVTLIRIEVIDEGDEGKEDQYGVQVGRVSEYFAKCEVPVSLSKKYYDEIMDEANTRAQFPGFRKGEVPAHAIRKAMFFTVEACMQDFLADTAEAYQLAPADASDGADEKAPVADDDEEIREGEVTTVDVYEEVDEILATWKVGKPFTFHAKFKAVEVPRDEDEDTVGDATSISEDTFAVGRDDSVIDVDAEEVSK